jgi:hypothetical protein
LEVVKKMLCYDEDEVLPDGDYAGVIESAEVKKKTSEKSRSGWVEWMELKIAVSSGDGETHTVWDNVFPRNMRQVMAAIGKPQPPGKFEVDPRDVVGGEFRCRIYVDEFNGRKKNKVQEYYPGPEKIPRNEFDEPQDIPF